jgi:hypothetical protein
MLMLTIDCNLNWELGMRNDTIYMCTKHGKKFSSSFFSGKQTMEND